MLSIMETFFATWTNYGERTYRSDFSVSDDEARPQVEYNKDNILLRDNGIGTNKNNYESSRNKLF